MIDSLTLMQLAISNLHPYRSNKFNNDIPVHLHSLINHSSKVIEEERLAENAARLEPILQRELSSLDPSIATIVRGKGLLFAVVIEPQGGKAEFVIVLV